MRRQWRLQWFGHSDSCGIVSFWNIRGVKLIEWIELLCVSLKSCLNLTYLSVFFSRSGLCNHTLAGNGSLSIPPGVSKLAAFIHLILFQSVSLSSGPRQMDWPQIAGSDTFPPVISLISRHYLWRSRGKGGRPHEKGQTVKGEWHNKFHLLTKQIYLGRWSPCVIQPQEDPPHLHATINKSYSKCMR